MKRITFVILALSIAISSMAQQKLASIKNPKRTLDNFDLTKKPDHSNQYQLPLKNSDFDVSKIYVGKAAHQRGVRREEAHIIDYNFDMEVTSVTNIPNPEDYDNIDEAGIIGMWYSTDRGQMWSEPVILFDSLDQGPGYYFSGGLFNPPGNTSIENMYGVAQGTIYPTSGEWRFLAFGSSTLGGEHQTNYLFETEGYGGYFNIFGFKQFENEVRCLNVIPWGSWGAFFDLDFQLITGQFDAENHKFDWDLSNIIDFDLRLDSEAIIAWIGLYQGMDTGVEICWSNDGYDGYMWVVGVSDDDASGYQPIVFKTENAGYDWDYIYLDFFENDIQEILEEYLIEASYFIFKLLKAKNIEVSTITLSFK